MQDVRDFRKSDDLIAVAMYGVGCEYPVYMINIPKSESKIGPKFRIQGPEGFLSRIECGGDQWKDMIHRAPTEEGYTLAELQTWYTSILSKIASHNLLICKFEYELRIIKHIEKLDQDRLNWQGHFASDLKGKQLPDPVEWYWETEPAVLPGDKEVSPSPSRRSTPPKIRSGTRTAHHATFSQVHKPLS